jgi:hypothetical protein
MLSHLVGGQDVVTDLFAFMNHIGIQGMGLVEATERSPGVGYVIGDPSPLIPRHTPTCPLFSSFIVLVLLVLVLYCSRPSCSRPSCGRSIA